MPLTDSQGWLRDILKAASFSGSELLRTAKGFTTAHFQSRGKSPFNLMAKSTITETMTRNDWPDEIRATGDWENYK
ncbi:hypothetical protein RRG08_000392 [Elysia crispata]|uniref:Uncharacterized protein n=1 Tax=Elysia crispata TaxID=231223 RepID=A0AAE1DMQ3_9GAST|nr:hypothetical protein RRG08_000392 [Elysia crispata]